MLQVVQGGTTTWVRSHEEEKGRKPTFIAEEISVESAILRIHNFREAADKGGRLILQTGFIPGTQIRLVNVQVNTLQVDTFAPELNRLDF